MECSEFLKKFEKYENEKNGKNLEKLFRAYEKIDTNECLIGAYSAMKRTELLKSAYAQARCLMKETGFDEIASTVLWLQNGELKDAVALFLKNKLSINGIGYGDYRALAEALLNDGTIDTEYIQKSFEALKQAQEEFAKKYPKVARLFENDDEAESEIENIEWLNRTAELWIKKTDDVFNLEDLDQHINYGRAILENIDAVLKEYGVTRGDVEILEEFGLPYLRDLIITRDRLKARIEDIEEKYGKLKKDVDEILGTMDELEKKYGSLHYVLNWMEYGEKPADEDIELARELLKKIEETKMKMFEAGIIWVRGFENLIRARCKIIEV